ncbi:FAM172 family protein homolog CG10038 [Colias croceus]|uniref:FAM172 family protein homolog CG10038 n=1 Tax=Colias crocea TaxID=72248 RepID=UPI001E27B79C|nr:FAM172 family protein homolog CG10038 [Colias croceus]
MFKKLLSNFSRLLGSPARTLVTQERTMGRIKTMQELGYGFNADGQLRKLGPDGVVGDEPFEFNISNDHQECQSHYEVLGAAVTEHIYQLLEDTENLSKLPVPKGTSSENGTFVFVSKDYDQKDTILVLIQGTGAVRAGQWARSLIINENLDKGTQIPYIQEAVNRDFGILVMNPNDTHRAGKKIPNSSSSEEHATYVWKTYIADSKAKNVVIIAHSYGGLLTVMLSQKFKSDFENRVKAVAFTDSVHSFSGAKISDALKKVAINWIATSSPLDTPMKTPEFDITRLSAGHPQHEMTSYACMSSVFKFIDKKLKS